VFRSVSKPIQLQPCCETLRQLGIKGLFSAGAIEPNCTNQSPVIVQASSTLDGADASTTLGSFTSSHNYLARRHQLVDSAGAATGPRPL
jgi:hypothetical protein